MREIQTALVGGDACVSFWSAVERIHRICEIDVCDTPRQSLEEVVPGTVHGDPKPIVVADLPDDVAESGDGMRAWLGALRAVLAVVLRRKRADVRPGYLFQAVGKRAAKWHRNGGRRAKARAPLDAPYLRERHPDPYSEWLVGIEPERLIRIVEALPEPGRTVIRMCCRVGWSAAMLAPLLGMTASAVGSIRDRSRRLVRRRGAEER